MNWNNYFKSNTFDDHNNLRFDCQLVTAVNAAIYLNNLNIQPNSNYYKKLLELGKCNYGPCINIENIWQELGIWENKRLGFLQLKNYLKSNCFLEINVWHKDTYHHSCAIVDYCKKSDACRVANFKQVTTNKGWIFFEDLMHYLTYNINHDSSKYVARNFKKLNK